MAHFSESDFYSAFKTIRNRFRRYKSAHLVSASLEYLRYPTKNSIEDLQKHPWLVLLLVKWVLLDEEFSRAGKVDLPRDEFQHILQMMLDLASRNRMPSEYPHYRLFFRNVAYQQFTYQTQFNLAAFARQSILFCNLPENHTFKRQFEILTGLSVHQFVELAFCVLIRFLIKEEHFVPPTWFSSIEHQFSKPVVEKFFQNISVDSTLLREYLLGMETPKASKANEYYEETPFIRYPLLRSQRGYESWHPTVLYRGLEYFIYDTLRAADPSAFMSRFGPIFEKYVEASIAYLGLPFATEAELSAALPGQGKVVDFLLTEDGANVFMDAKGVEMAYLGKVSHRPDIVSDKLKESAIKGIRQGFDSARRLAEIGTVSPIFKSTRENYLLIVTYKELYLGSGSDMYEAIARPRLVDLLAEYDGTEWIPFRHIYFLTIDDLDRLVQAVKCGQTSVVTTLRNAVTEDSVPSAKTFVLGQRIPGKKSGNGRPEFLELEFQRITTKLENYFPRAMEKT